MTPEEVIFAIKKRKGAEARLHLYVARLQIRGQRTREQRARSSFRGERLADAETVDSRPIGGGARDQWQETASLRQLSVRNTSASLYRAVGVKAELGLPCVVLKRIQLVPQLYVKWKSKKGLIYKAIRKE